jgi:hypothetical protein
VGTALLDQRTAPLADLGVSQRSPTTRIGGPTMITILAILLGFVLVSAAMRGMDWVLARRLLATSPAARSSYDLD